MSETSKKYFADDYSNGTFPFPQDLINPDDKDEKWHLAYGKAVMHYHVSNNGGLPFYSKSYDMQELRQYGKAKQPTQKYMNQLMPEDPKKKRANEPKKGFMNISWDNSAIYSEMREAVIGKMMKYDWKTKAVAVDPLSVDERKEAKAIMEADMQLREFIEHFKEARGFDISESEYKFRSKDQIDLYMRFGYKFMDERYIEILLDQSWYLSSWSTLKRAIIEDAIDVGFVGMKMEVINGMVQFRYVDPANAIVPYSWLKDYRNKQFAGEVRSITMGELRRENPDIHPSIYKEIAKKYLGKNNNPTSIRNIHWTPENESWPMDTLKVWIADIVFESDDVKRYMEFNRYGNDLYKEVPRDYELTSREEEKGDKLEDHISTKLRKVSFVLGSDLVVDYGQVDWVPYVDGQPQNPYEFYRVSDTSITEKAISFIDDIQLAVLKMRNFVAKATPPGFWINKTMIDSMTIGGVKFTGLELTDMFQQTGIGYFDVIDDDGMPIMQSGGTPIIPWQGGMGQAYEQMKNSIYHNIEMLQRVTGINDLVAGQLPSDPGGVRTSLTAVQGTDNVLNTIVEGIRVLKERVTRCGEPAWRLIAKNDPKVTRRIIGEYGTEMIGLAGSLFERNYDVQIEAVPTDEDKQELLAMAMQKQAIRDQQGRGGITTSDLVMIKELIRTDKIQLGYAILAQLEEQRTYEDEQRSIRMAEANAAAQAQAAAQAEAFKAQQDQRDLMKKQAESGIDAAAHREKERASFQERVGPEVQMRTSHDSRKQDKEMLSEFMNGKK